MKNTLFAILIAAIVSSCGKDNRLENFKNQVAGK